MNAHPASGFSVTRVIDAPRTAVWRALVDPVAFATWFGTDAVTVPTKTLDWDARAGLAWSARMVLPGGATVDWEGDMLRVDEPRELAFTITDDASNPQRDEVVFTLAAEGTGCALTLTQSGGGLNAAGYEQAAAGWGGFLDVIERIARG